MGWNIGTLLSVRTTLYHSKTVVGRTEKEADVQLAALEKHVRRGKDKALSQLQISHRHTARYDQHGQDPQSVLRHKDGRA